MASQKKSLIMNEDEKRQYNALMDAIHGGVKRDVLANNAPKFSTQSELVIQKNAATSPILSNFWGII